MKKLNFQFTFYGRNYDAVASEYQSLTGDVHFFCTPSDEGLKSIYDTQLIVLVKDGDYEYGFPGTDLQAHEYMHALATGLREVVFARA